MDQGDGYHSASVSQVSLKEETGEFQEPEEYMDEAEHQDFQLAQEDHPRSRRGSDADSAYDNESLLDEGTRTLASFITDYRYEHGRRYHAYKDGAYWVRIDSRVYYFSLSIDANKLARDQMMNDQMRFKTLHTTCIT
jgi:hypothetical protein